MALPLSRPYGQSFVVSSSTVGGKAIRELEFREGVLFRQEETGARKAAKKHSAKMGIQHKKNKMKLKLKLNPAMQKDAKSILRRGWSVDELEL